MKNDYLKGWLIKANTDIKTVSILIEQSGDLLTDIICFHSQQAIEKFLKSFLISKGVDPSYSHNLEYVQDLCIGIDSDFNKFNFGALTDYSVTIRYGNDFHIPSDKEASESYQLALEVKKIVLEKLNITESDLIL